MSQFARSIQQPSAIRAPIVRRDQVLSDQDYVEVFLDPLNTRRSASFFRVSARGILTDGQYDDENRIRDYAPDLDFQAATIDRRRGWTAEIRVPLSSLRYQAGSRTHGLISCIAMCRASRLRLSRAHRFLVARTAICATRMSSTEFSVERADRCQLIPHIEYARIEDDAGTSDELDAGIDLTWKPRENTVVDATIFPDFSQIEADVPQLTANTQFALALTEKRPFFLEGTDLLTTQIPAIYTRAFTDPDAGVSITDRSRQARVHGARVARCRRRRRDRARADQLAVGVAGLRIDAHLLPGIAFCWRHDRWGCSRRAGSMTTGVRMS